MKLTILGCYSATPRVDTNPTAQVLDIRNHLFLIDCGEKEAKFQMNAEPMTIKHWLVFAGRVYSRPLHWHLAQVVFHYQAQT